MCSANPNCANHKDKQRQIESTQRLFQRRSQAGRCNQMQPATSRTDRGPRGIDGTNQSRRIQTDKIGRCNAGARKRHPLLTFASVDRTPCTVVGWFVWPVDSAYFVCWQLLFYFLRRLFLTAPQKSMPSSHGRRNQYFNRNAPNEPFSGPLRVFYVGWICVL
jgi:hypothetical protein